MKKLNTNIDEFIFRIKFWENVIEAESVYVYNMSTLYEKLRHENCV